LQTAPTDLTSPKRSAGACPPQGVNITGTEHGLLLRCAVANRAYGVDFWFPLNVVRGPVPRKG